MSSEHDDKMENLLEISRALLTKLEGHKTRTDWQNEFEAEANAINSQNQNDVLVLKHRQQQETMNLEQRHQKEIGELRAEQQTKVLQYHRRIAHFWSRYDNENPRGS
jgi:hypothetical protein